METNLVIEGLKLIGLGIGIVFVFLVVLIATIKIVPYIIQKFSPTSQVSIAPSSSITATAATTAIETQDNKKIVAAITAAIKHHREG